MKSPISAAAGAPWDRIVDIPSRAVGGHPVAASEFLPTGD